MVNPFVKKKEAMGLTHGLDSSGDSWAAYPGLPNPFIEFAQTEKRRRADPFLKLKKKKP